MPGLVWAGVWRGEEWFGVEDLLEVQPGEEGPAADPGRVGGRRPVPGAIAFSQVRDTAPPRH